MKNAILDRRRFCGDGLRIVLFLALFVQKNFVFAQLDTIHWIPPMHARDDWGPQYLYLSTPEAAPFDVSIRDGSGALIETATISNSAPFSLDLGATNDTKTLVPESLLHQKLTARGLVIDGPKPFYAYFRAHSDNQFQACDLTCKGRAALGQIFRIGHLDQRTNSSNDRSNFVGVMATEDSTWVGLADFDPLTDFRINGADVAQPSGFVEILLNRGESAVFSMYLSQNSAAQPPNGFMGMELRSTKNVVVNCGSWKGAPVTFGANDIGIDQIAPVEQVGDEYILCRGNGSAVLEHPIVVAHFDGTQIFLNGATVPAATLSGGEFFVVPTSFFSAGGNMHVRGSKPFFMYQMIGGTANGDDQNRTAGLIFVPPISCGIPDRVDNIFLPNQIGSMRFEGGLMVVAMRDSAVTVTVDGAAVALGSAAAVAGAPDFVTYRNLALFDQNDDPTTIKVEAKGAVQVAMFGRNEPASFAAFFSGFSKTERPKIAVTLDGDGVCPDTLRATGHFDGISWIYEDSIVQQGPDTFFVAWAPGPYVAEGFLGVCRRTDLARDTVEAAFVSPAFPYSIVEPSCFNFSDGEIHFGQPTGGAEPFSFSIDNGKNFSQMPDFEGLKSGVFRLIARDSTGCYNRPLEAEMGQPDSFSVKIVPKTLPEPLFPGDLVRLEGQPDRPVVEAFWSPKDSADCLEQPCLEYSIRPNQSLFVDLEVTDSMGCPARDRIWLEVTPNVYAPNVFWPESGNGVFTLFSREALPILRMRIFDRWGDLVFSNENFVTNDLAAGWDGLFRGKAAPPAVYVWWAEVERVPGEVVFLKGGLTLVR